MESTEGGALWASDELKNKDRDRPLPCGQHPGREEAAWGLWSGQKLLLQQLLLICVTILLTLVGVTSSWSLSLGNSWRGNPWGGGH